MSSNLLLGGSPLGYGLLGSGNPLLDPGGNPILMVDEEGPNNTTTLRVQPPAAVPTTNSDGAIITILTAPLGQANTSFADWKISYDGAGNCVNHFLGDRTGTSLAPNWFAYEADPRAQSTNSRFVFVRGGFLGSQLGTMLDIQQGAGIKAIEANTVSLAGGNMVIQTTAGDIVPQPSGDVRPFTDALCNIGQSSFRFNNAFFKGSVQPGNAGFNTTSCNLWTGTGVPSASLGANGDYYFRADGGSATHLYFKSGGTWAATAA